MLLVKVTNGEISAPSPISTVIHLHGVRGAHFEEGQAGCAAPLDDRLPAPRRGNGHRNLFLLGRRVCVNCVERQHLVAVDAAPVGLIVDEHQPASDRPPSCSRAIGMIPRPQPPTP